MRVPVSWLREYAALPAGVTARELAARLIAVGLEVETVDELGADITGPVVVGRVLAIEELTGFKKPIRYCRVDVGAANGSGDPQNIICGARNFSEGDLVVVALPGAVLPGGFAIGARKTYGRMSEGMICSATELSLWEDHEGIIVLPEGFAEPGTDAFEPLGLRDDVLDIAVTPDRGYALSVRGVAREAAAAYGVEFRDPADVALPAADAAGGYPASVADAAICSRYVLRGVTGFDPDAPTPLWMKRRLAMTGVRSVSLAVDVTNYVMMELGQPLHAWDRARVRGPIEVRAAHRGERLETLDHVKRTLDPDDILITDESGPINIAGVMGGLDTEIGLETTDVLIEAAHFDAAHIARSSRRHQLSSESSRRFERGVDSAVQLAAATRAVLLLEELGGAVVDEGVTHIDLGAARQPVALAERHAARVAGVDYPKGTSARRLREVGCEVAEADGGDTLLVTPPSWRPDLGDPNDLAEEVIRLEGYENIPSVPPRAPAGRGLTSGQRLRRAVGRGLAGAGFVEVLSYPFLGERDLDGLQLGAEDARRRTLRLANPLNDDEPLLRTTLLPGLLKALARNVGRGFGDVALFETGLVYLPREGAPERAPMLAVDRGPTGEELAAVEAAIPEQPRHVGAVLAGDREPAGWWGPGRPATWADAIEAAREVAHAAGAELVVRAARREPWHPGRCAALYVAGAEGAVLVGHAGELHPRTVAAFGLPARTAAMELVLDLVERAGVRAAAPEVSTYPVATRDVALVVDAAVPAGEVEAALREGAGELLESVRLFDVYTGEQVEEGRKSLAYALRFRAADRTLTAEEVAAARAAAVAAAAERTGAVLRG
ncbi:phenylalanine--tRNA ligase subunit beta [Marinitenerispora sediminis]|uniref:Phenylalanine--tRNA ligase beta subunit n=1 Tax=Marinitenerispora sediminis TaxID=1931232 RepID=A0A368T789_9ACTN|nr:phenylalanine--tRNA ligase subunit beta [Marinitenerispora sediminis]RCV53021.1 phenylalanine--tRNA ligase subunit beta [Marinitenerispora sediminis]RCV56623.1 phenylalanine--tRNA ligase subunit beta [Marinitenerispora sediminis]RCV59879.1 phenylalanine--tRNA ligase subunit beta [Marinitenerispora sediminis]